MKKLKMIMMYQTGAPSAEETVLEDLECQDPFAHRKVGVTEVPWKNKKCPSCKVGFNSKSKTIKCHGCDSFTHSKTSCMSKATNKSQFFCVTCSPEANKDQQETGGEKPSEHSSYV